MTDPCDAKMLADIDNEVERLRCLRQELAGETDDDAARHDRPGWPDVHDAIVLLLRDRLELICPR